VSQLERHALGDHGLTPVIRLIRLIRSIRGFCFLVAVKGGATLSVVTKTDYDYEHRSAVPL